MGYRIFMRCLSQVLRNWLAALKLSWFWMIVLLGVLSAASIAILASAQTALNRDTASSGIGMLVAVVVLVFILAVLGGSTIAVGWHRYVLREERIGWFVFLKREWPTGKYIWKTVRIGIILLIPGILFSYMLSSLVGSALQFGVDLATSVLFSSFVLLINLGISSVMTWLFFRLGVGLPAIAVGKSLSLLESFELTRGYSGSIFVASVLAIGLNFVPTVLTLIANAMFGESALTDIVALSGIPVAFISFFVSVGILTVLYGHLVEGRPV